MKLTLTELFRVGLTIIVIAGVIAALVGVSRLVADRADQARRDKAQDIARSSEKETYNDKKTPSTAPVKQTDESSSTEQKSSPQSNASGDAAVTELPTTGLVDAGYQAFVIGLMSFVVVSYWRSRRHALTYRRI